jgi:type II secretory ATPase GspE/PulE/Tfp pilus assembly ATPase PilB-like protein
MIGEIRDAKTANIALEAAYTGHLIIATLHTADCESTLYRLAGFKCDPFLLGYCLKGIISQKLIESAQFKTNRTLLSEVLKINKPMYAKDMDQLVVQCFEANKNNKLNSFYSFEEDKNKNIKYKI